MANTAIATCKETMKSMCCKRGHSECE
uniref:Uncharacterized protein n=1 Tax=Anguilla anguilla TaxID=7936 RepID=A0A0E9RBJ1_ANGAN